MKAIKTSNTKKAVARILIIIQGIITAVLAVVVSYGIFTGQF